MKDGKPSRLRSGAIIASATVAAVLTWAPTADATVTRIVIDSDISNDATLASARAEAASTDRFTRPHPPQQG